MHCAKSVCREALGRGSSMVPQRFTFLLFAPAPPRLDGCLPCPDECDAVDRPFISLILPCAVCICHCASSSSVPSTVASRGSIRSYSSAVSRPPCPALAALRPSSRRRYHVNLALKSRHGGEAARTARRRRGHPPMGQPSPGRDGCREQMARRRGRRWRAWWRVDGRPACTNHV